MASLRVVSGELAGTTVEITDELVIGRADAGLALDDDPEVSRQHAIVRRVDGSLEVEDLGSSNGTFVDGLRIEGPTRIEPGATVTVGTTELVVEGGPVSTTTIAGQPDPQALDLVTSWAHDPQLTRGPGAVLPPQATEPPPASQPSSKRRRGGLRARVGSRRLIPLALALALLVAGGLAAFFLTSSDSSSESDVIDVPVRFRVTDQNRSVLPCKASGNTYELAGRLVAPSSGARSAVTVYTSGVIFPIEFEFHNQLVPGYDWAREMAKLGHTSVLVDRVGYGKTTPYPADGRSVCMGAHADMLHQVVGALRTGGYDVIGSDPRKFKRVALAGYSIAAMISEVEAASFGDADAVIAIGWAHQGFTDYGAGPDEIRSACSPGLPKEPTARTGYFRTLSPQKVIGLVSPQADRRIVDTFWWNQEVDACGQFISALPMFFGMSHAVLARITVPVLILYGWYDVLFKPEAWQAEWAQFKRSRDRTLIGIPDGQMLMLDKRAALTRRAMSAWMKNHGF